MFEHVNSNQERRLTEAADYEVGHKKPPREFFFKTGCSGNSKGRPKRRLSFGDILMRELRRKAPATVNGVKINEQNIVYFVQGLVKAAITKGPSSKKLLLDLINRLEAHEAAQKAKRTEEELWPKQEFSWDDARQALYDEMMGSNDEENIETGEPRRASNKEGDDRRG